MALISLSNGKIWRESECPNSNLMHWVSCELASESVSIELLKDLSNPWLELEFNQKSKLLESFKCSFHCWMNSERKFNLIEIHFIRSGIFNWLHLSAIAQYWLTEKCFTVFLLEMLLNEVGHNTFPMGFVIELFVELITLKLNICRCRLIYGCKAFNTKINKASWQYQ